MDQFPWWDSRWLMRYARAKKYLATHAPAQLQAFVEAFNPLRTPADFQARLHHHFFNEEHIATIEHVFRAIKPEMLQIHDLIQHGRFVIQDHPMLVDLHAAVAPAVGEFVGEKVEPSFSYIALYNRNGKCPVHLDAPNSKWTLGYCFEQSEPWPIAFSEVVPWPEEFVASAQGWQKKIKFASGHSFTSVSLEEGQAVMFSGSGQWHYREPLAKHDARTRCDLLFLQFIPEGTQEILDWENWERIFSAAGLTEAIR